VNQAKYIGMDVHQATISVAVMDSAGKLIQSLLETKAATILRNPHKLLDRKSSREIDIFVCVGVRLCACVSFNLRTT
jgi:hypothetical protein